MDSLLDQRHPGIANQVHHRTAAFAPGLGQMNPGLVPNAALDGIGNPLQQVNDGSLVSAPMPQPQAQGWNPAEDEQQAAADWAEGPNAWLIW